MGCFVARSFEKCAFHEGMSALPMEFYGAFEYTGAFGGVQLEVGVDQARVPVVD